jgi:TetR/AcrR family tetracycline transcriptional repressor
VLANTPLVGPQRLRHIEALLRILRAAGLKKQDAARAGYHLNNFVTEFAADEARFAAFADRPGVTRRRMLTEARRQFKSLPADEYPTLVELADHLTEDDQDGLFQFGIEMCLRGIDALATKNANTERRKTHRGTRQTQLKLPSSSVFTP